MREVVFAVALLAAAILITTGTAMFSHGAGLIAGGVLLAGWSWLVLGERE